MTQPALIMIADDDMFVRYALRLTMDAAKFRVIEASDGEAAISMARDQTPEVRDAGFASDVCALPNPFNPSTTLSFDIPHPSFVVLTVHDVLGREVASLVRGVFGSGFHTVVWNASDAVTGLYFAHFTATDVNGVVRYSEVSKLALTK